MTKPLTDIQKQVYELYKLIDDIDTALDMFKGDYEAFAKNTARRVKKRFEIVPNEEIDKLYDIQSNLEEER
jgi:hypothetical protein